MKTTENYLSEIKEIRKMMEESSRFLSLSGLSGILVGIYAIVGAIILFQLLNPGTGSGMYENKNISQSITIALIVLIISLVTIIVLTSRKTKKAGKKFWNAGSRLMMVNLAIPLITGGLLVFIFIYKEYFDLLLPVTLLFYGLALVNAAKFTRHEIFYLGIFEILLGIFAAIFTTFSLLIWAIGFGILHIIYGTLMYFRYEHNKNE